MRNPREDPGVTAGRVWEAGAIHQSHGLSGLGQQLRDTGGLRTDIWCFTTELTEGESIKSCGVVLHQSKPRGCNKQVSQGLDECPSCQLHTALLAEGSRRHSASFCRRRSCSSNLISLTINGEMNRIVELVCGKKQIRGQWAQSNQSCSQPCSNVHPRPSQEA